MKQRTLISVLQTERQYQTKGGIYHKLQVDFAYNSNHIEGSQLSHDQTQYIFDTHTVGIEPARIDDIFETVNHFRCFDILLQTLNKPLTEDFIKLLHKTLKTGTLSSQLPEAVIGEYKKYPNFVGNLKTTPPKQVETEINELLARYHHTNTHTFDELLDFHAKYERIHPFYDGNGRTGRLILFRECLRNNIIPFIISDQYKVYYYNGLKQWQTGGEKGYLRDTCLLMQDNMKNILDYFEIPYDGDHITSPKTRIQQAESLLENMTTHQTDNETEYKS